MKFSELQKANYPVVWDYHTINSNITTDQVWYADATYYVSSNITIGANATLKIEPGTIVKFARYTSLNEYGTLVAKGNPYEYIVFTSARDPNMGEVIDNSAPAANDWCCLELENSGLEYCKISYAAYGVHYGGSGGGEYPTKNCIFYKCGEAYVLDAVDGSYDLFNNLFMNCTYGVHIWDGGYDEYVNFTNNTFIQVSNAITIEDGVEDKLLKNNLFVNCGTGIQVYDVGCNEHHNAFYGCGANIKNDGDSVTPSATDRLPAVTPLDGTATYLGCQFLNTNANGGAMLINAGDSDVENYYNDPENWTVHHVANDASGTRVFTSATTLSADTIWQTSTDVDTGTVDIGYHHPRVDYFISGIGLASHTLTVKHGTVVAVKGSIGYGKIISNGTPDDNGRIIYTNYALAHAGWESIKYRTSNNWDIRPTNESEFSFSNIVGLHYGIYNATFPTSNILQAISQPKILSILNLRHARTYVNLVIERIFYGQDKMEINGRTVEKN